EELFEHEPNDEPGNAPNSSSVRPGMQKYTGSGLFALHCGNALKPACQRRDCPPPLGGSQ
ncbi:MAG: hypothetical protein ACHQIM_16685, partial [Sphingobacteriales bacterium]